MLRFVLDLLYFFRFYFVFLFVKSYVGWEFCALASHLHVLLFPILGLGEFLLLGRGQYPITRHDRRLPAVFIRFCSLPVASVRFSSFTSRFYSSSFTSHFYLSLLVYQLFLLVYLLFFLVHQSFLFVYSHFYSVRSTCLLAFSHFSA